jgi:hypothetical protein
MLDMATVQGLLSPIGADPIKMCTSLYADDAMLFLRPIASDVRNLQYLLNEFGMATGLCTNIQKSEIFPIRCDEINLSEILGDFQVQQGSFPCKYLGLPLRIGRLRREDKQMLIDKVTGKLPRRKGKLLNKAGRLTLVNFALSSVDTYHMTVSPLSKWAIKRLIRSEGISCGMDLKIQEKATAWSIGEEFSCLNVWAALASLILPSLIKLCV